MLQFQERASKRAGNRLSRLMGRKRGHLSDEAGPPTPAKNETTIAGPPYQSPTYQQFSPMRSSDTGSGASREKPLPPPPPDELDNSQTTNITLDSPYESPNGYTPRRQVPTQGTSDALETAKTSPSGPPPSIPLPKTPQLPTAEQDGPEAASHRQLPRAPVGNSPSRAFFEPIPLPAAPIPPNDVSPGQVDLSDSPSQPSPSPLPIVPSDTANNSTNHRRPLPVVDTLASSLPMPVESPASATLAGQNPARNSPTRTVSRPKGPRSPGTPTSRQASGSSDMVRQGSQEHQVS